MIAWYIEVKLMKTLLLIGIASQCKRDSDSVLAECDSYLGENSVRKRKKTENLALKIFVFILLNV